MTSRLLDLLLIVIGAAMILRPAGSARVVAELTRAQHRAFAEEPVERFQVRPGTIVALGVCSVVVGIFLACGLLLVAD
jgi:hypothetical protein